MGESQATFDARFARLKVGGRSCPDCGEICLGKGGIAIHKARGGCLATGTKHRDSLAQMLDTRWDEVKERLAQLLESTGNRVTELYRTHAGAVNGRLPDRSGTRQCERCFHPRRKPCSPEHPCRVRVPGPHGREATCDCRGVAGKARSWRRHARTQDA